MPLRERFRETRLGRVLRGMRQIRGNIDGFQDNEIVGWVAPADGSHLSVGAYTSHGLVAQASANVFRGDLLAEGIGLGDYGFCIPLTDAIRDSVARQGGMVELRTLGKTARRLGSVRLPDRVAQNDAAQRATGTPSASRGTGTALGQLMFGDLEALADLARVARKRPPTGARSPYRPHAKMFAGTDYLKGGSLPDVMSAYAEYVRYRYKLDTPFPIHDDPENVAHFLNWYIAGYGPLRRGLRTPLSAGMLDFLNAPVVIGGQRPSLTQVTWSFLMGVKPILTAMDFNNPDWVFWAVYWWSIDQAKAMHCEDCLVPEAYIELLAGISEGWHDQPWPLTQFMIRIHAQTDGLSQLDMGREADRRELTLALMAMAARRPDYLRYLPEASIAAALKETNEGCLLDRFLALHSPDRTDAGLDAATFAALLRLRGFDLESRRFVTLTDDGHRFEAAMLPPVEEDEMVDIQLIGPFEKASGLGQATRLSQAVLAHTGYSVNPVNFGLDNPAPEGFSKTGKLSDWKRTRVNLIHLNAESIPLVYAYAPDVFSEAYNIGYFYWELDSPAACHFLGMDLLDEIWVSTDYGVEIYGPANKGRPVTNVGMCYEDLPDLDRATSRAFVKDRFGFEDGVFVFLVAFDSFSFIQRKNPIGTLRAFAKAFEGVKNVRLIIKTQNRTKVTDPVQQEIWKTVDKMVEADDRIHVLDETLVYDDLLRLKQGSDCYVSLHKSEGWGFGMIEAMNLGVPVVATGYSGNMDFCTPETAWLVDYTEVELDPDDYIFVRPGQKWAEPDVDDAARQLHAVFSDEDTRKARAEAARTLVRTGFSEQAIARRYGDRLKQILPQKPERAS